PGHTRARTRLRPIRYCRVPGHDHDHPGSHPGHDQARHDARSNQGRFPDPGLHAAIRLQLGFLDYKHVRRSCLQESHAEKMKKLIGFLIAVTLALPLNLAAQGRGGGRGGPPPTPKAGAPIDLTGYWVSVVSEDWRYRMVTPPKGDME